MKYYYLISSLPELHKDDTTLSQEQLDELIDLIFRNLESQQQVIGRCLLLPADNQNLLYILFREYHDFEIQSFSHPISIPVEILENYRREYSVLPDYMANFLNDLAGSFSSLSLRDMEHFLNQYFYEYISKLDSQFLNTYFVWRFWLKRTISELNIKSYPFLHTKSDSEEPFFSNLRTFHGLTNFEDISGQLMPFVESNDLEAIEQRVNGFYWEFADCWQEPFTVEQVYVSLLRIIRLHRWKGFTSQGEQAKVKFEMLINDLKQKEIPPKMPVI